MKVSRSYAPCNRRHTSFLFLRQPYEHTNATRRQCDHDNCRALFPDDYRYGFFQQKPHFFWAWDAPRFFWQAWALAGIGLAATLSELFLPPKNQRLRAILALVFAIVAIALTYFIHQDAAAAATQFEYNLRQQIDSSALLGMLAGGAANIGATLKQVPQASKINWYHVDIATYVWTFALIGYGIDALKRFLVEARTALNQAET